MKNRDQPRSLIFLSFFLLNLTVIFQKKTTEKHDVLGRKIVQLLCFAITVPENFFWCKFMLNFYRNLKKTVEVKQLNGFFSKLKKFLVFL